MGRKFNTKHPGRRRSNYPERLRRRGVSSASVRMRTLKELGMKGPKEGNG